jgi:hypothetical protein
MLLVGVVLKFVPVILRLVAGIATSEDTVAIMGVPFTVTTVAVPDVPQLLVTM